MHNQIIKKEKKEEKNLWWSLQFVFSLEGRCNEFIYFVIVIISRDVM